MSTLERAIVIAVDAHAGQRDKGGAAYILHPLRVMLRMATDEERIVAVLHDVVEDSHWTLDRLRAEGFPERVVVAIDSVTRRDGESYDDFVLRAGRDPVGRRVKLAELEDNYNVARLAEVTGSDMARMEKYHRAIEQLREEGPCSVRSKAVWHARLRDALSAKARHWYRGRRKQKTTTLDRAIVIATEAHAGQVDKAGAAYILHPLRLMLRMATDEERVVAVLHDVVEDSHWTLDRLRAEGFSERVVLAIDSVSRREEESYDEFIVRARRNPIGRRVKLADLADNCDATRLGVVTAEDMARIEKYRRAIEQFSEEAHFPCSVCSKEAGHLRFSSGPSRLDWLEIESVTGSMGLKVPPKHFDALGAAIADRDVRALFALDWEYAPFFCPDCNAIYCADHWEWGRVHEPDGWVTSEVRGRCPKGHTRTLES